MDTSEPKLKNRFDLAKYFNTLGFKIGAEIGVFDGYYSEILCKEILGLKLYAIDPWEIYDGYRDHRFKKNIELAHKSAIKRLQPFNCEMIKKFSMDAVKDIADESLDFVYIDGNHQYNFVQDDIREWAKKVRKGGMVSGHDYYVTKTGNTGVINAVNEYASQNNYKLNIIWWCDEVVKEDDRQPNWYFFK